MMEIKQSLLDVIAASSKTELSQLDPHRSLKENGLDSLGIVVVREEVERSFQVRVSDVQWLSFRCINDIAQFIERTQLTEAGTVRASAQAAPYGQDVTERTSISQDGLLSTVLEIGMPLTGRNHLAEGPLLQRLGDLRWSHMCRIANVQSKGVVDDEGNRLYSTFFYVEMNFPESRPMAYFGENDRLKITGDLRRFGTSTLDGTLYLVPEGVEPERMTFQGCEDAVAAGIPSIRLSNVFVMQFNGAEWLRKSRPANPGFERITESAAAPDSYALVKEAEKNGRFSAAPTGYLPLTDAPVITEYQLIPDRDLNGAGLVYFANYPVFLDICERQVLEGGAMALTDDLINRRTLVRRKSAYLNNASARDRLKIAVEPWIENPFLTGSHCPEMEPIRLFFNYRMYRESDQRLMMVSTAQKTVFGRAAEDLPFFEDLRTRKAPGEERSC